MNAGAAHGSWRGRASFWMTRFPIQGASHADVRRYYVKDGIFPWSS